MPVCKLEGKAIATGVAAAGNHPASSLSQSGERATNKKKRPRLLS